MLNEGNYVYYDDCIDDYYLPGKSWYGIRHHHHDGIFCGYDDNDMTFSVAAYDINWVFNLIKIPQNCYIEALSSSIGAGVIGNIHAYKIKQNDYKLDTKKICDGLKDYLNSDLERYPTDAEGIVKGVVVHDYLLMYIQKLKDGSIPHDRMDWRSLRPMWEQKRCMYNRIFAIEEENDWNHSLSESYKPIIDKANNARIMYALYHKKPKEKMLMAIENEIISIKDEEMAILSKLVECMSQSEKI